MFFLTVQLMQKSSQDKKEEEDGMAGRWGFSQLCRGNAQLRILGAAS